ncbi:MAG: hypothetical protein ACE14W_08160 [Candidatus Velamenicoccus archaeovorus]
MNRPVIALVAAVLAAATACTGGGRDHPEPREPVRCQVDYFSVPPGFHPVRTFEERYPDHVGTRLSLRDGDGRELHVFSGIPGEFGEGLPSGGTVEVTGSGPATLLGRKDVWVLWWEVEGPCSPRAVLGNGLSRERYLQTLADAGLVQA